MLLPIRRAGRFPATSGEMVMIEALAFALVAIALGFPALAAAMFGSHQAQKRRVRQLNSGLKTPVKIVR